MNRSKQAVPERLMINDHLSPLKQLEVPLNTDLPPLQPGIRQNNESKSSETAQTALDQLVIKTTLRFGFPAAEQLRIHEEPGVRAVRSWLGDAR